MLLSHLAVVFAKTIKARCQVENGDVFGAALTGDAQRHLSDQQI